MIGGDQRPQCAEIRSLCAPSAAAGQSVPRPDGTLTGGRRAERPRPVASGLAEGRRPGEPPARPPADTLRLYPKAIRRFRSNLEKNPFLPMTWIVFVAFFIFLALIL